MAGANDDARDDDDVTRVDALADLPPLPPGQRGESKAAGASCRDGEGGDWSVTVANAGESSGYLCRVHATASFPRLHPGALYAIFTHPRNEGVFSGIKRVAYRSVLEEEEEEEEEERAAASSPSRGAAVAYRKVEVEQVGELRILMARREFTTRLVVEEDARGAALGRYETRFALVRSDALARFDGAWRIEPWAGAGGGMTGRGDGGGGGGRGEAAAPASGAAAAAATTATASGDGGRDEAAAAAAAPGAAAAAAAAAAAGTTTGGCRVRLEQQVLPRGVPAFMQRVPLVGALLRRVSLAAVEQLMRDLQRVAAELRARHPSAAASGDEREVHAALDALKRERRLAEQLGAGGQRAGAVSSFAPAEGEEEGEEDDGGEDEDDDERDDGGGGLKKNTHA